MGDVVIQASGLSKRYWRVQGAIQPSLVETLAGSVRGLWRGLRKFRRAGSEVGADKSFWALRDVSFEVRHGEVVGIIGRNGAGKSTLLKVLSRITEPSEGYVRISGRMASLLEVGIGFHPELTGRDNIFLSGAILGMKKSEISRQFDAIVDFAGVERFIYTPVKRYSSGMYVRLAFAVAAFLESDMLLIDEVLAVGDADFQKKCLGRMHELARGGRTVLFVSHNMAAISELCDRALILSNGRIRADDVAARTVELYLSDDSCSDEGRRSFGDRRVGAKVWPELIEMRNDEGDVVSNVKFDEHITLHLLISVYEPCYFQAAFIGFNSQYVRVFSTDSTPDPVLYEKGRYQFKCHLPASLLAPGLYRLCIDIHCDHREIMFRWESAINWVVEDRGSASAQYNGQSAGVVCIDSPWHITKAELNNCKSFKDTF